MDRLVGRPTGYLVGNNSSRVGIMASSHRSYRTICNGMDYGLWDRPWDDPRTFQFFSVLIHDRWENPLGGITWNCTWCVP